LEHLNCAGGGEILWVEAGRVVSKLVYTHAGILNELTPRTVELWGASDAGT
jgi:hypothetical protein